LEGRRFGEVEVYRIMLEKISSAIDAFSRKEGEWSALLIIPLTIIVIYEVIMRYVFDAPTIWGFEATTFIYGVHFMLGLAYTHVTDGHVKVDIFTGRAKPRTQAVLAILTNLFIFLPVFTCMTIWAWKFAITSTVQHELNSTSWAPPHLAYQPDHGDCLQFFADPGNFHCTKSYQFTSL
jgi:TRAP-type mannitol/chloroaromatic compound transport system permease small subunit